MDNAYTNNIENSIEKDQKSLNTISSKPNNIIKKQENSFRKESFEQELMQELKNKFQLYLSKLISNDTREIALKEAKKFTERTIQKEKSKTLYVENEDKTTWGSKNKNFLKKGTGNYSVTESQCRINIPEALEKRPSIKEFIQKNPYQPDRKSVEVLYKENSKVKVYGRTPNSQIFETQSLLPNYGFIKDHAGEKFNKKIEEIKYKNKNHKDSEIKLGFDGKDQFNKLYQNKNPCNIKSDDSNQGDHDPPTRKSQEKIKEGHFFLFKKNPQKNLFDDLEMETKDGKESANQNLGFVLKKKAEDTPTKDYKQPEFILKKKSGDKLKDSEVTDELILKKENETKDHKEDCEVGMKFILKKKPSIEEKNLRNHKETKDLELDNKFVLKKKNQGKDLQIITDFNLKNGKNLESFKDNLKSHHSLSKAYLSSDRLFSIEENSSRLKDSGVKPFDPMVSKELKKKNPETRNLQIKPVQNIEIKPVKKMAPKVIHRQSSLAVQSPKYALINSPKNPLKIEFIDPIKNKNSKEIQTSIDSHIIPMNPPKSLESNFYDSIYKRIHKNMLKTQNQMQIKFEKINKELLSVEKRLDFAQDAIKSIKREKPEPKLSQTIIKKTIGVQTTPGSIGSTPKSKLQGPIRSFSLPDGRSIDYMDPLTFSWSKALNLVAIGDINAAYETIISTGDDIYLIRLMHQTSPYIGKLKPNIASQVLNKLMKIIQSSFIQKIGFSWLSQAKGLSGFKELDGPEKLEVYERVQSTYELIAKGIYN